MLRLKSSQSDNDCLFTPNGTLFGFASETSKKYECREAIRSARMLYPTKELRFPVTHNTGNVFVWGEGNVLCEKDVRVTAKEFNSFSCDYLASCVTETSQRFLAGNGYLDACLFTSC